MLIRFYEHALKKLDERKYVYCERIISGSIHSMEDYRLIYGRIESIEEAKNILKELMKSYDGDIS